MLRVASILLTSIATWFCSRLSLPMEHIALRQQVAVYQLRMVGRHNLAGAPKMLALCMNTG